ncbi:hypothetical protein [Subtercola sp. RTI3]|uniref:hypothetical protein n=1 Tax=Subtercola sp. RTI3 TaxID=3048639 RepID=UPI002B23900A|nr:hypothetical protein [Subtercola sp. RTI3]MEA9983646.1 hypothetical protein [Subtercola sp. RTI3]
MGIPHSQLQQWDEDDIELMLAHQLREEGLGTHGFPFAEATNPDADPTKYTGGYRYVADEVRTDWADKARLDAVDAYRASHGEKANLNGKVFPVRRVDYTPVAEGQSLEGR